MQQTNEHAAGTLIGRDSLADQFLEFMLSDDFQSVIPTTNWMYPVRGPVPDGFETLIQPKTALLIEADKARAVREEALAEWLGALSN